MVRTIKDKISEVIDGPMVEVDFLLAVKRQKSSNLRTLGNYNKPVSWM